MGMKEPYMLTTETARLLQVSAETVRIWESKGKLKALKAAGGVRLFLRADVEALAKARQKA